MLQILPANLGNESIALIQYLSETKQSPTYVVVIDTGFGSAAWHARKQQAKPWVEQLGFIWKELTPPLGMMALIRERKSFPSMQFQWCAGLLKGIPLLTWLDDIDSNNQAVILLAKRQAMVNTRTPIPARIESCDYHGGRTVIHPVLTLTDEERDSLIRQAGFDVLPHASEECAPCIYSSQKHLAALTPHDIKRVQTLEAELSQLWLTGLTQAGEGIANVTEWAKKHTTQKMSDSYLDLYFQGCGNHFGCGL